LRPDITPFTAIHVPPWRAESETVLGFSWVAVVGVLRGVGRTLLYGNLGDDIIQKRKRDFRQQRVVSIRHELYADARIATPPRRMRLLTASDTLARRVRGAADHAGSPGATFRARARLTTSRAILGRPCFVRGLTGGSP
jgi:hypothetical protein